MTVEEILRELESYGAREPVFGVKVADIKKILKKLKKINVSFTRREL